MAHFLKMESPLKKKRSRSNLNLRRLRRPRRLLSPRRR